MLNYTIDEGLDHQEFIDAVYGEDLGKYIEQDYYDQEIATWNTIEED
jgi:hypothetical protein